MKLFRCSATNELRFDFRIHLQEDLLGTYLNQSGLIGGAVIFDSESEGLLERLPEGKDWKLFRSGGLIRGEQADGVYLDRRTHGLPTEEVFSKIAARRLPVLVWCGDDYSATLVEKEILPQTSTPIVLGSLGCYPCSEGGLKSAVELAQKNERVYLELSAVSIGNFIKYAAEIVPDRLVFGSQAPFCEPDAQWSHVAASVLNDETLVKVARETSAKIFEEVTK